MNTYRNTNTPGGASLFLATLAALVTAVIILVTVVLPAEYAIDPTGMGRILGLTQMGEIKTQLAAEAAAAKAGTAPPQATALPVVQVASAPDTSAPSATATWQEQREVVLSPSQGVEIKLVMDEGAVAEFEWDANGSRLNCDTHGDNQWEKISYKKSRGTPSETGQIKAAFQGNHGWFWRNRTQEDVTLTLKVRGDYKALKRIK